MTNFDAVIDKFLGVVIQDYRIDNLYTRDKVAFNTFMNGIVKEAIELFDHSNTDLSYAVDPSVTQPDANNMAFVNDIPNKELSILADIMNYLWVQREVNDIRAMSEKLSTRDFKVVNTPQIFKQKMEYLDELREKYLWRIQQLQMDAVLGGVEY